MLILVVGWALLEDCHSLGVHPEVVFVHILGAAVTAEHRADIAGWILIAVFSSLVLWLLERRRSDSSVRPSRGWVAGEATHGTRIPPPWRAGFAYAAAAIVAILAITALYGLRPKPQNDIASRIRSLERARSTITELQRHVDSSYRQTVRWSQFPHKNRNVAIRDLRDIEETPTSVRETTANYSKRYGTTICNVERATEYSPNAEELASTVSDERFIRPSRAENFGLNQLKRNELRSAYFYMDHARHALAECLADLKMRQQNLEIERLEFGREGMGNSARN